MNLRFEFPKRSNQAEILDDFELEGNDLSENLRELEKVNLLLGGYAIIKDGVKEILENRKNKPGQFKIIDVGCGAGDTLRFLATWGGENGIPMQLIGLDANPSAVNYARKRAEGFNNIEFSQQNILNPDFSDLEADLVMFNLFMHHFNEQQIVEFLSICMNKNCAVLINDLHRSKLAYHAFRLLSRILGFSYISRHDGKLSVRRSFTRSDWEGILAQSGIENYRIKWKWAFRYQVLIYNK